MHRVNNSIKLSSLGKIQTWFICTIAIWIPSSTFLYLLCNFYGWMWSSVNSFLSVLWWRGVSIRYRLTGEFWIKSTAWDFFSLYRLLKKLKGKLSFLFVAKTKLFIMKLFFEEFSFFTAESAWSILKCNKGSDILGNFEVIFYSIVKEITFWKGIFLFINIS